MLGWGVQALIHYFTPPAKSQDKAFSDFLKKDDDPDYLYLLNLDDEVRKGYIKEHWKKIVDDLRKRWKAVSKRSQIKETRRKTIGLASDSSSESSGSDSEPEDGDVSPDGDDSKKHTPEKMEQHKTKAVKKAISSRKEKQPVPGTNFSDEEDEDESKKANVKSPQGTNFSESEEDKSKVVKSGKESTPVPGTNFSDEEEDEDESKKDNESSQSTALKEMHNKASEEGDTSEQNKSAKSDSD